MTLNEQATPQSAQPVRQNTDGPAAYFLYVVGVLLLLGLIIVLIGEIIPRNQIIRSLSGLKGFSVSLSVVVLGANLWLVPRTGGRVRRVWVWFSLAIFISLLVQVCELLFDLAGLPTQSFRILFRLLLDFVVLLLVVSVRRLSPGAS